MVLFVVAPLLLPGCATMGLQGEGKTNVCQDAKTGIAMARIALPLATKESEREYWLKWLAAAEASAELACVGAGAEK